MNTVSFGSTFKIKGSQDYVSEIKLVNFCDKNDLEYSSKIEVVKPAKSFSDEPIYDVKTSIISPDNKDNLVETYLKNKGIKFKKINTSDLLDKKKIESRIKDAPKGMKLVKVDVKKLDDLRLNQDENIVFCEDDYDACYKDSVNLMIKSGDKITPTTLCIKPTGETVDETVNYINKFGSDNLNKDQLLFVFSQRTNEPDHCTFFGMKDLGMDKVPVYVDKDTFKIGNALGILKKTYIVPQVLFK